jgi:hypothetical protein
MQLSLRQSSRALGRKAWKEKDAHTRDCLREVMEEVGIVRVCYSQWSFQGFGHRRNRREIEEKGGGASNLLTRGSDLVAVAGYIGNFTRALTWALIS